MAVALLYHVSVRALSRRAVVVTLAPTWLGRFLQRRVRSGMAKRARGDDDELHWWWDATEQWVGGHIEKYIEVAPLPTVDDMTVEELLLDRGKEDA